MSDFVVRYLTFTVQVTSELPEDMAGQLRLLSEWVPKFGDIFGGLFLGLGLLTSLGAAALYRWGWCGGCRGPRHAYVEPLGRASSKHLEAQASAKNSTKHSYSKSKSLFAERQTGGVNIKRCSIL